MTDAVDYACSRPKRALVSGNVFVLSLSRPTHDGNRSTGGRMHGVLYNKAGATERRRRRIDGRPFVLRGITGPIDHACAADCATMSGRPPCSLSPGVCWDRVQLQMRGERDAGGGTAPKFLVGQNGSQAVKCDLYFIYYISQDYTNRYTNTNV